MAKKKKQKWDWTSLETEYISTSISLRRLSDKYKIPIGNLADYSKANKWVKKRKNHQNKIITKTTQKLANEAAKQLAKEFNIADKLADVLGSALKDGLQFNRYVVSEATRDGISETKEKVFDKVDMKSVSDAVKALKEIASIKATIGGITTAAEQRKIDFDREKLDIERRKLAMAEAKEERPEDDGTGGVIFIGEVDESTLENEEEVVEDE